MQHNENIVIESQLTGRRGRFFTTSISSSEYDFIGLTGASGTSSNILFPHSK